MKNRILIAGLSTMLASVAVTASYANAEVSGSETAQPSPIETTSAALSDETVPVFISEEVVQPLPEVREEEPAVVEEIPEPPVNAPAPKASSLRSLVAKIDTSAPMTREMECLAGTVYFEARGEPLEGQLAVAKVVMNRAASRTFPSSYCGVVTQRSQFSFVKNGRIPAPRRGSKAWSRAKAIARIAHEDLWDSKADDALYFHAKHVSPSWRHKKSARATISSHIFYR